MVDGFDGFMVRVRAQARGPGLSLDQEHAQALATVMGASSHPRAPASQHFQPLPSLSSLPVRGKGLPYPSIPTPKTLDPNPHSHDAWRNITLPPGVVW